jgi:hypothetical protein
MWNSIYNFLNNNPALVVFTVFVVFVLLSEVMHKKYGQAQTKGRDF